MGTSKNASSAEGDRSPMVTAVDLRSLLLQRYKHPEWSLQFEVQSAKSVVGQRRSADAIAMNLFSSRGFTIHGFEIKCSRKDWQTELKKPAKAEAFAHHCDFWWLVAPRHLVKDGELPQGWGLLAPGEGGRGLEIVVQAGRRAGAEAPDRAFLATMLQQSARTLEQALETQVDLRVAVARNNLEAAISKRVADQVEREMLTARDALQAVQRVQAAIGIDLRSWKADDLMLQALHIAQILRGENDHQPFVHLGGELRKAAATLDAVYQLLGVQVEAGSPLPFRVAARRQEPIARRAS